MLLNAWSRAAEDPLAELAAAQRASVTAERHVVDAARNYERAVSRGNTAQIAATKAAFRQAFETDIRRKGLNPEEVFPGYQQLDPVPVSTFFGSELKWSRTKKILVGGVVAAAGVVAANTIFSAYLIREYRRMPWWKKKIVKIILLGKV